MRDNMIILDSNIWIAFFNTNDTQHKKAEKVLENADGKIIITEYIILEVSSVLLFKVNKNVANKFIEIILNNKDVEILLSDEFFFKGTLDCFQNEKTGKLSFIDASLLYLSEIHRVFTFDKKLKKEIRKMRE
ncbi:MAG: type II toxin-antitoxin system VapC family toxin [bacterium]